MRLLLPSVLLYVSCSKTAMQHSPKELKQMGWSKFPEALISQIVLKRHYIHCQCHSVAGTPTSLLSGNSEDFCFIKGVNNIFFQIDLGSLAFWRPGLCWMTCREPLFFSRTWVNILTYLWMLTVAETRRLCTNDFIDDCISQIGYLSVGGRIWIWAVSVIC